MNISDLTLEKLQQIIGGKLLFCSSDPTVPIRRLVTDSRLVETGDVFWALSGPDHNGADFVDEAYSRGAEGLVSAHPLQQRAGIWTLQVDDTLQALRKLARWQRDRFRGTVIAVTGSVGKTTTRQMIHTVLRERLSCPECSHHLSTQCCVPLNMIALDASHDYTVIELDINNLGEFDSQVRLCEPRVVVITQVTDTQRGSFESQRGLAESQAKLLGALPADGWAVLNGDDPWLRKAAAQCRARIVWVGRSADCLVAATHVHNGNGRLSFNVGAQKYGIPVWGRHHLTAALAAVAVGRIFELTPEEIATALAGYLAPPMRCEVTQADGVTIINDACNASPTAMRAALELLRDFEAAGRRVVVFGEMLDLGHASPQLHRELGSQVVTLCGADRLIACGKYAHEMVTGAMDAGMPLRQAVACRTPELVPPLMQSMVAPGDVVLVKGSSSTAMKQIVHALEHQSSRTLCRAT